jgi:Multimeric flavodoxin WrbA
MNITVLFGSHRFGGTNYEIEKMIGGLSVNHEFKFIHMANHKVESCLSCHQCVLSGKCILPASGDDHFQEILDCFINSDAILIVSPVYAGIPSRLTALLERMTSVLFDSGLMNTDQNPLLYKKVGIFSYCSTKICDDTALKILFQKFVMKNYSFDMVNYDFLNSSTNPNDEFIDITDYIKQVILKL